MCVHVRAHACQEWQEFFCTLPPYPEQPCSVLIPPACGLPCCDFPLVELLEHEADNSPWSVFAIYHLNFSCPNILNPHFRDWFCLFHHETEYCFIRLLSLLVVLSESLQVWKIFWALQGKIVLPCKENRASFGKGMGLKISVAGLYPRNESEIIC
jgi:hypothetical protein